jgi:hypothetical protein
MWPDKEVLKFSCVRYRLGWKAVHLCNHIYAAKYNNILRVHIVTVLSVNRKKIDMDSARSAYSVDTPVLYLPKVLYFSIKLLRPQPWHMLLTVFKYVLTEFWPQILDYIPYCATYVVWDSVVSTVARYVLDDPGIESWGRQDFLHSSRPTQPPI